MVKSRQVEVSSHKVTLTLIYVPVRIEVRLLIPLFNKGPFKVKYGISVKEINLTLVFIHSIGKVLRRFPKEGTSELEPNVPIFFFLLRVFISVVSEDTKTKHFSLFYEVSSLLTG